MTQRLGQDPAGHVGDTGDPAHAHTHVVGSNGLADRAHAHSVRSQSPGHTDLRRRLISRACELYVNALLDRDVFLFGHPPDDIPDLFPIHITHIRESGACLLVIGPDERRRDKAADMVAHQHKIPGLIASVHAARCIGEE